MKLYQKVLLGSAGTASAGVVAWRTMIPWIADDIKIIKAEKIRVNGTGEAVQTLLIDKFEKLVEETPKKTYLIFEDNLFSYEFVDQMACKVANIARSWGLGPRDCVAMMIQNEPAFIWTFLGLQKLGIIAALINFNLKLNPLVHSVLAADPKYLIVGAGDNLLEAVTEVIDDLGKVKVYVQGSGSLPAPAGIHSFDSLMLMALPSSISASVRKDITPSDICTYIYTSGTTGLPKPALFSHEKAIGTACKMSLAGFNKSDILYTVLPLYHSAGGGLGFFGTLVSGATLVLKKKFSASQFWSDCRRYDVTFVQYIGELFRYLLSQPPSKLDAQHKVRVAFGNGLRKDIWLEVNKRFKIPLIAEFFSSTEGTKMLINLSNKPGGVGRLSPLLNIINSDAVLVKFDYATALPIRDKNGRCIKVGVGEPGLCLTKVPDASIKNGEFIIYKGPKDASEKKIVRDAFQAGDIYFNYGDVLILDKDYFLYFHDRIGDTFRWKGENVSTTEVANVISVLKFVHDANVYGVLVSGNEGRAGMVAMTLNEGWKLGPKELKELYEHVCEEFPTYARPLFIRLLDEEMITGTFKQQKVELMNDGFDPIKITNSLYYLDIENKTYSRLTASNVSKFLSSKL